MCFQPLPAPRFHGLVRGQVQAPRRTADLVYQFTSILIVHFYRPSQSHVPVCQVLAWCISVANQPQQDTKQTENNKVDSVTPNVP